MQRNDSYTYRKNRAIVLANNNVCSLCGRPIDMELKAPNPMSASVDHVIAVAKGGTDDIENLRPAHLDCNRKKYNKAHADIRNHGGVAW
jgi:5-methylcytosine-specific restriction endonuclease McrA